MTPFAHRAANLAVPHGFFGRQGGVSRPPFDSLNGSLSNADDPAHAAKNRARVASALGASALVTARQVHGDKAIFVAAPFSQGDAPCADGLITDEPGLAVAVLSADCVPVLFAAPNLAAAAHAGWRGSLAGIIEKTADALVARGADRRSIQAAIGPHLRQPSFEVGEDLVEAFCTQYKAAEPLFTKAPSPAASGKYLFNHTGFVRQRLLAAGLAEANITDVGGDTLTQQDRYFTYRGARQKGQEGFGLNLSAIALPLS